MAEASKKKGKPAPRIEVPECFSDVLAAAEQNASTEWEQEFVREQSARFEKFGDEFYLSEKQLAVLKKIASKTVSEEEGE